MRFKKNEIFVLVVDLRERANQPTHVSSGARGCDRQTGCVDANPQVEIPCNDIILLLAERTPQRERTLPSNMSCWKHLFCIQARCWIEKRFFQNDSLEVGLFHP
jgi:hypothetical protein